MTDHPRDKESLRASAGAPAAARPLEVRLLAGALGAALVLRLVHVASAARSPLTYQPGPDEDFYTRFGEAVAAGQGSGDALWGFMDPAYGYLLGAIFAVVGSQAVAVYLLQAVVDTFTAAGLARIGRELGRPAAGLWAAFVYAVTATAILFTATLLKATWVANFMVLWTLAALVLLRTRPIAAWLLFGVFCGYGVALRSNLLLMAGLALVLLPWLAAPGRPRGEVASRTAAVGAGLAAVLLLLAWRGHAVSGAWSPLPTNGGIVLHQVYNADNPRAVNWQAPFVHYFHPAELWRGYAEEAGRRAGRALTPAEVSAYWRGEAVAYLRAHPFELVRNAARKLRDSIAYTEVPNNRSYAEERLFSPVLRLLPPPFGWLLALGLPGLVLLLAQDRRGWLVVAPVLCTGFTVAIFFAEDRFRFHAVPALAFGAGMLLERLQGWLRERRLGPAAVAAAAAAALGATSVVLAQQMPQRPPSWDRIVWGYVRMGDLATARATALRAAAEQPANATLQEALAHLAAHEGRLRDAAAHYRRAVELRPESHIARYNLARALVHVGDREGARREAARALELARLPEYEALARELGVAP